MDGISKLVTPQEAIKGNYDRTWRELASAKAAMSTAETRLIEAESKHRDATRAYVREFFGEDV